jgi:hypothetical protein
VQLALQTPTPGVGITVPTSVDVPGDLVVSATIAPNAPDSDITGFVTLRQGDKLRRIPLWLHVDVPVLGREPHGNLSRPGLYNGSTKGKQSRVSRYRYPEGNAQLTGPEQVFRVNLRRQAANFGVVVVSQEPGVSIEPRVVFAGDENHLTGYPALPTDLNPYLPTFGEPVLTAGAIRPAAGAYDVVFDSRSPSTAGKFTFRYWVNDQSPPRVQVLTPTVVRTKPLRLRVVDTHSGVNPQSIVAAIDGQQLDTVEWDPETSEISIDVSRLSKGHHALTFQVSDYQETKNMENVAPILPNTRQLRAQIVVS